MAPCWINMASQSGCFPYFSSLLFCLQLVRSGIPNSVSNCEAVFIIFSKSAAVLHSGLWASCKHMARTIYSDKESKNQRIKESWGSNWLILQINVLVYANRVLKSNSKTSSEFLKPLPQPLEIFTIR